MDRDSTVEDRAGGSGAFHGTRHPAGEWELRGFAHSGQQEQTPNGSGQTTFQRDGLVWPGPLENFRVTSGAGGVVEQEET